MSRITTISKEKLDVADRSYAMNTYTGMLDGTTRELVNSDGLGPEASAFPMALVVAGLNEDFFKISDQANMDQVWELGEKLKDVKLEEEEDRELALFARELDGHGVVTNTILNPNSAAYRLPCGKVLSESKTYQQDLFSPIIEQAASWDQKVALCLEYDNAWKGYGPSRKRSREELEENAGECWDESHDEVEMDGELPPGYPYSETWRYCLFRHGEDKEVLKKHYEQLDTESEDEISPTEAEKSQGPGKSTDYKDEEPRETEEQGWKGVPQCPGGATEEKDVGADATATANDAKTSELKEFPGATSTSTDGVEEEYSARLDFKITEKREEKEENTEDQPPSTHMINVEVERVMSRVGRCDREVCRDEGSTKPEVGATEKAGGTTPEPAAAAKVEKVSFSCSDIRYRKKKNTESTGAAAANSAAPPTPSAAKSTGPCPPKKPSGRTTGWWPKSNTHDSAPVKRRRIIRENVGSGKVRSEQETSAMEKDRKKVTGREPAFSESVPKERIQKKQEQEQRKEKEMEEGKRSVWERLGRKVTGKEKTDEERKEERKRRFEESKAKHGKKEKGKVTNEDDEVEIVTEVPAEAVSVPPADRKLAERRRQSQVDRLLAKSAKIAAPILAKRAAIPTASSPSQAAEGKKKRKRNKNKKKHAEKEKQPERLSEKAGRKQAEEAPNEEDEDVITLEVTPEEMHELFCEPGPSAKKTPTFKAPEDTSGDLGPMRPSLHVPAPKPPAKTVLRGSPAYNLASPIPSHKGMGRGTYRGNGKSSKAPRNPVPNPRTSTPTGRGVSRHGAEDPTSTHS